MKKMKENPELQAAITAILKDPATGIITEIPSLKIKKVTNWLNICIKFLKNNINSIGSLAYVIELCPSNTGTNIVAAKDIIAQRKAGFNVFKVDYDLKIIGFDNINVLSGSSLSKYSKKNNTTLLHIINGVDFIVYANGITIKEMNANRPTMLTPSIKHTQRSGYDYELSVQEHYKNRVRFWQACKHWHDRNKRILVGNRKTEEVFQESLFNWLYENLHDSQVISKVNKISNDETDIEIHHWQGDYFLIEIKWLGENSSGTKYDISKVEDGISQVKNYLIRDTEVHEAALIVYDGRPSQAFNIIVCEEEEVDQWKRITNCGTKKLPPRGKAYVFFLENEDASKRKQC